MHIFWMINIVVAACWEHSMYPARTKASVIGPWGRPHSGLAWPVLVFLEPSGASKRFLGLHSECMPSLFVLPQTLSGGSDGKKPACNARDPSSIPRLGRSLEREWQLTPVFLPGEFHGRRSMVAYSPGGHKESDTTEQLTQTNVFV